VSVLVVKVDMYVIGRELSEDDARKQAWQVRHVRHVAAVRWAL
jgi:hypothetical protein